MPWLSTEFHLKWIQQKPADQSECQTQMFRSKEIKIRFGHKKALNTIFFGRRLFK